MWHFFEGQIRRNRVGLRDLAIFHDCAVSVKFQIRWKLAFLLRADITLQRINVLQSESWMQRHWHLQFCHKILADSALVLQARPMCQVHPKYCSMPPIIIYCEITSPKLKIRTKQLQNRGLSFPAWMRKIEICWRLWRRSVENLKQFNRQMVCWRYHFAYLNIFSNVAIFF